MQLENERIQPSSDTSNRNCFLVEKADKAIEETSGIVYMDTDHALRLQKTYREWKENNPNAEGSEFPHPQGMVAVHPPFLESVIRRLKKNLDNDLVGKGKDTGVLTVRNNDIVHFNEALVRTFEEIESDDRFDSEFLLSNITEEFNNAIIEICEKEHRYKLDPDIEQKYQLHTIDNDQLIAFILNRLIDHRDVNKAIRFKDYQSVIKTFASFERTFSTVLCNKLGRDKATILLNLIKSYCDPKTESLTMYNLIDACKAFNQFR